MMHCFGRVVGIGDQIDRVFVFDLKSRPGVVQQQALPPTASLYRNRKQAVQSRPEPLRECSMAVILAWHTIR